MKHANAPKHSYVVVLQWTDDKGKEHFEVFNEDKSALYYSPALKYERTFHTRLVR